MLSKYYIFDFFIIQKHPSGIMQYFTVVINSTALPKNRTALMFDANEKQ